MLEAIIFDYGTIVSLSKREFKWFNHWSLINKVGFNFQNSSSFRDFYRAIYSRRKKVKDVYENLSLPYLEESENFIEERRKFISSNHAVPYEGISQTIKIILEKGVNFLNFSSGKKLRFGIKSNERGETIYNELSKPGILKYFDTIIFKELLDNKFEKNHNFEEDIDRFSLSLILNKLGSEGKNTLYITDNLNSLLDTYKLRKFGYKEKFEKLICIGAEWSGGLNYLSKGIKTPDGKKIFFKEIVRRPFGLRDIIKKYS